jgi:hypothetical protein
MCLKKIEKTKSNHSSSSIEVRMDKKSLIIHPFLFALYPVLIILVNNTDTFSVVEGIRSILVIWLVTGVLLAAFHIITKNKDRAGLLATLFIFMLLYLGSSYSLPPKLDILGWSIHREYLFFSGWAVFTGVTGNRWVWQRVRPHVITRYLNIIAAVTLINPVRILITLFVLFHNDPLYKWENPIHLKPELSAIDTGHLPDIYYIILDGYGRADVLKELYQYDNSTFLDHLEERGFFIASNSQSNYIQTGLSLASSMNLEYLDFFNGVSTENRRPLTEMILDSKVRKTLEGLGYTTVSIRSEYPLVDLKDADVYIDIEESGLNGFEKMVLSISSLRYLDEFGVVEIPAFGYKNHWNWVLDQFDALDRTATVAGPKFVYVHITAPHPPFVFGSQGELVKPDMNYSDADGALYFPSTATYIDGYRNQVEYINKRVASTIDHILRESPNAPIIILQGDHGPGAYLYWESAEKSCIWERVSILNAYYLPGIEEGKLYAEITPVNTFRLIFDSYFGMQNGLLEDKTFFSSRSHPYQFMEVNDPGGSCR